MKPLKLSIMPMPMADAGGTPNRSKNRTSSASRAAVDGRHRAMNWIAYCSISTGM